MKYLILIKEICRNIPSFSDVRLVHGIQHEKHIYEKSPITNCDEVNKDNMHKDYVYTVQVWVDNELISGYHHTLSDFGIKEIHNKVAKEVLTQIFCYGLTAMKRAIENNKKNESH